MPPASRRRAEDDRQRARFLEADRPDARRLDVAEATALGLRALARVGYPNEEARIITDQLIDNSLCGYRFAGLPRILAIAHDAKTGAVRTPIRVIHETANSALLDGGNNVGYVAVYRDMEIAIAKAKAAGVASVGVCNSYYSGRNACYLERIALKGLELPLTPALSPHAGRGRTGIAAASPLPARGERDRVKGSRKP